MVQNGFFVGCGEKMTPYFHTRVETAYTKHGGKFSADDKVKVLPSNQKFPVKEGMILRLVRGNHGKGRVFAVVKIGIREDCVPLGRCRHL